jgi:hypothetical protein
MSGELWHTAREEAVSGTLPEFLRTCPENCGTQLVKRLIWNTSRVPRNMSGELWNTAREEAYLEHFQSS